MASWLEGLTEQQKQVARLARWRDHKSPSQALLLATSGSTEACEQVDYVEQYENPIEGVEGPNFLCENQHGIGVYGGGSGIKEFIKSCGFLEV
jgi:hypothetical protein